MSARNASARSGSSRARPRAAARSAGGDAQLNAARELLAAVLRFDAPADAVVSRHFRAHPQLGQRDRHVLAETVYQVVRQLRLWRELAQGAPVAPDLALLALGWQGDVARLGDALAAWREQTLARDLAMLPAALRYSLPDWLAQALAGDGFDALATSLLQPAPLDLRVNVLKATRDEALQRLRADGIDAQPTPLSPWGLRVHGKPALQHAGAFVDGWVEVQDEGSQLLALLLAPRRGEMVADFCAGAGGKTLALGAMMRNSGRLYAFDTAAHRLDKLRPRLARSGLSNVYPVVIAHERDDRLRRLAGKLDRVLVDAPCSGTGTLRRNPDLKWRLHGDEIARLAEQQGAILRAAAQLVKPGGRLVYATCSLLRAENQDVVDAFVAAQPGWRVLDAGALLAQQQLALSAPSPMLELRPERDGTDGFFAAVLQRE
jgi:16S rRNA (cytosine967-C5)-methyltransferase